MRNAWIKKDTKYVEELEKKNEELIEIIETCEYCYYLYEKLLKAEETTKDGGLL